MDFTSKEVIIGAVGVGATYMLSTENRTRNTLIALAVAGLEIYMSRQIPDEPPKKFAGLPSSEINNSFVVSSMEQAKPVSNTISEIDTGNNSDAQIYTMQSSPSGIIPVQKSIIEPQGDTLLDRAIESVKPFLFGANRDDDWRPTRDFFRN